MDPRSIEATRIAVMRRARNLIARMRLQNRGAQHVRSSLAGLRQLYEDSDNNNHRHKDGDEGESEDEDEDDDDDDENNDEDENGDEAKENDRKKEEDAPAKLALKKILIANRGEIAVRIASTIKKLGIHSVAIFSKEDQNSEHVKVSDSSFLLHGTTLAETYLSAKAIIKIAKEANADAVIPGYGFLSENADFAQACESAGLVWIGPSPHTIRTLAQKHTAREVCSRFCHLFCETVDGSNVLEGVRHALSEAGRVGYPVIVKSVVGVGGGGLCKCTTPDELTEAYEDVKHQAMACFNDDRICLEHFIENVRHIEVQIIGDGRGRVKHLGLRDCSLQRRNQKVIGESVTRRVPRTVCEQVLDTAVWITKTIKYRTVGSVEFLYQPKTRIIYFLKINTRLQVEHSITEAVCEIDLVESMIKICSNDASDLFSVNTSDFDSRFYKGHAIEVRICAENPMMNFQPATGQILGLSFPSDVRVDRWIKPGTVVSSSFDPLLAKLVVYSKKRKDAVKRLITALDNTYIYGIDTNLEYLRQVVKSPMFHSGSYRTTSLDNFQFRPTAFEVVAPGSLTTVQDYPGRQGFWHAGIPPSGPMDNFAFRMANSILENDPQAAGLECTSQGPTLLFHCSTIVVVVGPATDVKLDGHAVRMSFPILVRAGQKLSIGVFSSGYRCCVAFKGGIIAPAVFGSRSTFALGKLGGHNGWGLRAGDIVFIQEFGFIDMPLSVPVPAPSYDKTWILRVMTGPHAYPEYFTEADYAELFSEPWKVHYNSSRVGVKLTGPKPKWARKHGGEAGLHPSNIHDSAYSIGSISFTGDEAVILTCDGPSLGGFMVFATVVTAELWKTGQMKPGEQVLLCPITAESAMILNNDLHNAIENKSALATMTFMPTITNPILGYAESLGRQVCYRKFGDAALLLEFEPNGFDLRTTFHIHHLRQDHSENPIPGVEELTPGVRSLHIRHDPATPHSQLITSLTALLTLLTPLPTTIPSRTIHLPLAFDHPTTLACVAHYSRTIRSQASWLPDNVRFLQDVNHLASRSNVASTVFAAAFLVLGLGDVFLGAPCAVPLDPRHRLFGTKYNPPRSFTPEGTVGIGGQYMCIYGMDSPGGYQLVGRTVPIWNRWTEREAPWLLRGLDVVRFYRVAAEVLDDARERGMDGELVRIEEGVLDLVAHEKMLEEVGASADSMNERIEKLRDEGLFEVLTSPYESNAIEQRKDEGELDFNISGTEFRSTLAGRVLKCSIREGDVVVSGQELIRIESMKMEFKIFAPFNGRCLKSLRPRTRHSPRGKSDYRLAARGVWRN